MAVYEHVGAISSQEADEMIGLAVRLRTQVRDWIREVHPDLLPPELG
jgi:hypothetical protein